MPKIPKIDYEKEWKKEYKNLKDRIRYAETEKGLRFEELPLPDKPEKITLEDIEKIKSLKGENLWKYATYEEYDYADEDEYDSYEENVLQGVEERLASFTPYDFASMYTGLWHEKYRDYLEGLLDMAIADEGREKVARRLENEGATRINEIVDQILTDSNGDRVDKAIQEFTNIIYNGAMHPVSEYGY